MTAAVRRDDLVYPVDPVNQFDLTRSRINKRMTDDTSDVHTWCVENWCRGFSSIAECRRCGEESERMRIASFRRVWGPPSRRVSAPCTVSPGDAAVISFLAGVGVATAWLTRGKLGSTAIAAARAAGAGALGT
jgi:hypothetical protein